MKKLAVLISGQGSNLQAIIDACDAGNIEGKVCVVVSNRAEAAGLERARLAGIPSLVIDHRGFADRESFDQALLEALASFVPDLVILAGFMRILTPEFIAQYQGRLLNIHPSLLPLYPGLDTHRRALESGDSQTGATVHFVTNELDGGPPILFARVPIATGDTPESLAQAVQRREHDIYPAVTRWFLQDRLLLAPDGAYLDGALLPRQGLDADQLS
ncbi:MAG: phosphoribosylglycinamide formyltransferase [Pseudomonadota bacterium]